MKQTMSRFRKLFFMILVTLFSLLSHGYSFSGGDQSVYIPAVNQILNSYLFKNDYLFGNFFEGKLSLFFPLMAQLTKLTNLDISWLYFGLYIIFNFIILVLIYDLNLNLTHNLPAALVSTLILSLPKYVGGSTVTTLDISWLPRFFILPLLLIALNKLLSGKYNVAALLTGIIFLFHPFSGIYLGIFVLGLFWLNRPSVKKLITICISGLIPLILFIPKYAAVFWTTKNPPVMSSQWITLLQERVSYNFISKWQINDWGSLVLLLVLFFLLIYHHHLLNNKVKRLLVGSVLIASIVTAVEIILGEIFHITLILELQLLRIWLIPSYLIFGTIGILIISFLKIKKLITRLFSLTVLILLLSNFGRQKFLSQIELPSRSASDWQQTQLWAKNNTPTGAIFLTPAHRVGWRIFSQRSIVAEIKDGSSGLYNYAFARDWQERIATIHPLGTKTSAEIILLKEKYAIDYLVTFSETPQSKLTEVFHNPTFIIYKL